NRSLTFWIFFAMLAGLELGLDSPAFASQLRVFSDIFLRLIKVIVAPLILGTLITGIAGHGDLRKVGRIGWKSLVYFEAVTTIALTRVPEHFQKPILSFAESLTQVMFRFTNLVMYFAPIGVGAAMAYTVGHMGIAVLLPLIKLLLTAYGALIAFLLFVLLPIAL